METKEAVVIKWMTLAFSKRADQDPEFKASEKQEKEAEGKYDTRNA